MSLCRGEHEWSEPVKAWPNYRIRHCLKCSVAQVWHDPWTKEEIRLAKIKTLEIGEGK